MAHALEKCPTTIDSALQAMEDSPPSYTPSSTAPTHTSPSTIQPFQGIKPQAYRVPTSVLSNDRTMLTTTEPVFLDDPQALVKLLKVQATLPPRPVLRITGQHSEWGPEYGPDKVDFDLTLDLTGFLGGTNASAVLVANGNNKSHMGEKTVPGGDLEALAMRFCADQSGSKSLALERTISNWDTDYLDGQVRSLVASTGYAGKLTVWIGGHYSRLLVRTSVVGDTVVNPSKLKIALRKSFDMPPASAPQTPATLGQDPSANRYKATTVDWPYATAPPNMINRQALVQEEREFWSMWQAPVRNCVVNGRQGRVTELDRLDAEMGEKGALKQKGWVKGSQW